MVDAEILLKSSSTFYMCVCYCKLSIRRDRDEINELFSEFVQIYTNWYIIPFNMLMCIR